jgi:hypothetical protein
VLFQRDYGNEFTKGRGRPETLIACSAPRNERIRFRERIPNTYC